jgi:hypothetical protein
MTGGIALPFLNVYGFGVDLNTTVADLMSVAALSGGLLSGIGGMLSGLVQLVTGPAIMASGLGFDLYGSNTVTRGSGNGAKTSGKSTSQSGMVGNAAGDDVKEKTLSDAENDSDSQQANAK